MRVFFLTHRLPFAPDRGDRIRAYFLLQEMSRFASVSLFSLVHDEEEASHARDVPFASAVTIARVPRLRNLARGALRLGTSHPLTHELLDAPPLRISLDRAVRTARPDLVVAYCSGMARFALEPPLAGLPFILDMVDVDSEKWSTLAGHARGPRRWIYRREATTLGAFEARAACEARATLVVNARECEALKRIAPSASIRIVQNGIELQAFRPSAPPATAPVVVFCGVMSYPPNDDGVSWFAREVWPLVRAARPDARFIVVGGGATRRLRRLAAADRSIDLVGRVPAVQPYLWQSAAAVAPLHLARGLQNKVLEALAAGLPIVVTPAVMDGIPLEARDGCVEAADSRGFADEVVGLLAMAPDDRRRRAERARLEDLAWPTQLRPLESVFRAAAAQVRE